MEVRSTSATLVLERPTGAHERMVRTTECEQAPRMSIGAPSRAGASSGFDEPDAADGIGSLLRAPGLAVLASVFLVEGYRWLGVFHFGSTSGGSLLFRFVGLASAALLAPFAALALTSGRRVRAPIAIEDLVVASAVLVMVATGTALVVGGPAWRTVAGASDLLLAASALAVVLLGERARHRVGDPRAVHQPPPDR